MNTLHTLLTKAEQALSKHSPTPREDALALLQALTQKALFFPITHPEHRLEPSQCQQLDAWIIARKKGAPIAYLTGYQPFFNHTFKVNEDTLIPRPETEALVEWMLDALPSKPQTILDLGTGSGNIIISLAMSRPTWHCHGADTSSSALTVAKDNAKYIGASITWHHSNWWDNIPHPSFDAIVANPPYIAKNDPHLTQGDLRFEPKGALHSGPLGTEDLAIIIEGTPKRLNPNGWLFLEHGFDQGPWVKERLSKAGFEQITQKKDLSGHIRLSCGRMGANQDLNS